MLGRRSVFLIGPMGSGKSAVGRQLGRALRCPFRDSDHEIERRTGVDISFIFEREGEAGFREREREVLAELTTLEPVVLATGGGAILLDENRTALSTRGTVVYLQATVDQQVDRVQHGRHRPLLQGADPATRLAELMVVREPLYLEVADLSVCTDGRKVSEVVEEILATLTATAR